MTLGQDRQSVSPRRSTSQGQTPQYHLEMTPDLMPPLSNFIPRQITDILQLRDLQAAKIMLYQAGYYGYSKITAA
ncbi:hypothetical protein TNIN_113641 [Trichonephila inaurata madagascariensis]|uniref:Uncharacterized protein n=1 Tax=Trichonephila inaurata madagascariensis TaxID=2747483 RepID=A0A8X6WXN4_9ARAC|nr:hypothetical protein TNIN_113641 [Trichonephila inaurata madagascariensis]